MQELLKKSISMNDILSLFVSKEAEIKDMYIKDAANIFITEKKIRNRNGTVSFYEDQLSRLIAYFEIKNVFKISQINKAVINDFVNFQKAKGNTNTTINKYVGTIKTMIKYLEKNEYISPTGFSYDKLKETLPKIETVDESDLSRILKYSETISVKSRLILLILFSTGIRTNELCNIERCNIDFKDNNIYLTFTKSGYPRYAPMMPEVADLIKKYLLENPTNSKYLFYQDDLPSAPMPHSCVRSVIARTKKALNIEVLSAHKIRHLFATSLLRQGVDIKSVSKLLGHQDIRMTERYLDLTNQEVLAKGKLNNPLNLIKSS